jgi:YD repeat-containing protein
LQTESYDTLNHVTGLSNSWAGSFGFSYDALSRRTQMTRPNSLTTNYTYDYNGNMTSKTDSAGTTSYTWDYENRLASVTLPSSGGAATFKYDPFGRRVEKISPTTTSIFAYDGDNLVETVNASAGVVARYTQGWNVTYDSFGDTTNSSGSLTNFLRYTAREFDTETNLYFNRARYLDPSTRMTRSTSLHK